MKKVIIIVEAGVNHNGNLENAQKLVEIAAMAGADFIKFQTFKTELNLTKNAKKATYQELATGTSDNQYEMVKKLELSFKDFLNIKEYCNHLGIGFLSTGFDNPSLDFLESLNPVIYKIPSGEITNLPYLRKVAGFGRRVFMSTGMATMQEVKEAMEVLIKFGLSKEHITILHCNTEYPTAMEDVNLKAMNTMAEALGVEVGYSDHTLGIEVPIAAVAMGAIVIEKHFTLDRNLPGPDHRASLEPEELKAMISAIRNVEKALSGDGRKMPSKSEVKNKEVARKSIHTARNLTAGTILEDKDLIPLRPGNGISPMQWDKVVGKKILKSLPVHGQIKWGDVE